MLFVQGVLAMTRNEEEAIQKNKYNTGWVGYAEPFGFRASPRAKY